TAANSFTVTVTDPLGAETRVASINLTNGIVTIQWNSMPGSSYRVLYKNDLASSNWNTLIAYVTATGRITTATDDVGNAPQRFYRIMLLPPNSAPVLPAQSDRTINELASLVVTNTATDFDVPAQTLTYQLLNAPTNANIDANGVITWTAVEGQGPSTNIITTVVTDNGVPPASATNSFTVVVNDINVVPVLPTQTNRTIIGLATLVVTNTASDSNVAEAPLIYSLLSGPTNAVIDANGIIVWTPVVAQLPSTNVFTTVVSNFDPYAVNTQHLSATNSFTVVANILHNGPLLPAQTNLTINEFASLTVTNTAADQDVPALALTYHLLNPPAGMTISTNGVITWTPAEGQGPSTNVITTVVADNGAPSLSVTNSFILTVNDLNLPPVLSAQTNRTIIGLTSVVVTNTASDSNIPAVALTYSLLSGPTNAVIGTNGVISWTPVSAQVPGAYVFTTVVSNFNPYAANNQHLSATNSFTVTVNAIHNGPSLSAQVTRTINEFSLLTVTNIATDHDVPTLTLSYQLIGSPSGATIDTNGVITWTPAEGQGPSTNTITTVVVDNGSPPKSAANSFTVIVNDVNVAPVLPAQTNRTSIALAPVVVTNTATDANIPAVALTYSLLNGPT